MPCLFGRALRQSLLSAVLLAAFAVHAQSSAVAIDLPAAPLDQALNALARKAGVQILFASDIANGKTSPALKGNFAPREALDRLLAGQGLEADERGTGVYVVRRAQTKSAAPKARPAATRPAEKREAEPDADTLDTIVVTGEKTDRRLQDTTTSIAVTTAARIEDENIRDLYDILDRTANVTLISDNQGFAIRGMKNTDTGQAPLASIYLDGAALPPRIFDSGPMSSWDLAQIEVLRGPQSTIQGENALAGAVVMRTQDPTLYWDWRVRAQYSNPSDRNLAFAGGGPLIADELAFRVSAENHDNDGFIYNPVRNERGNPLEDTTGRAKLLWTPSGIKGLTVKAGFTRDVHNAGAERINTVKSPDFFNHRLDFSRYPNTTDTRTNVATLEADYAFSPAWTLSSVTNWAREHTSVQYDSTGASLAGNGYMDSHQVSGTRSQEFRLHHDGDMLDSLLGVYASQRDTSYYLYQMLTIPTPVDLIESELVKQGLPASLATTYANFYAQALPSIPYANFGNQLSERDRNKAVFGDGTLHFDGHWSLLGGFRYDRQQYALAAHETHAQFLGTYPDPASFGAPGSLPYQIISTVNKGIDAYLASGVFGEPSNARDFSAFLPKLGIRYEWSKDLSLSFVAQRGYRSGGSQYNPARLQNLAYDPEYTKNYEIALRSVWLDETLTLNANAFYTDWKDKQVSVLGPLGVYDMFVVNAGRAHMFGFEVEATQRLSAHFDWYASFGYERTRFDQFHLDDDIFPGTTMNSADNVGREFAGIPRRTFAIGANWHSIPGWFANLNANYRDSVQQSVGNPRPLAALFLVNAKAGYAKDGWSVYLFARNLLDRQYFTGDFRALNTYSTLGNPRVVGVGMDAHW